MNRSRLANPAVVLWLLNLALWAIFVMLWSGRGFLPLPGVVPQDRSYWILLRLVQFFAYFGAATLGALIIRQQPRNPIGWFVCLGATFSAIDFCILEYGTIASFSRRVDGPLPAVAIVAWSALWIEAANSVLDVPLLLVFPDGRLPSRRWRPLLVVAVFVAVLIGVGAAFRPGPLEFAPGFANPFGALIWADPFGQVGRLAITWGVPAVNLLAAASLWVRLRRTSGHRRNHIVWVAIAATIYWLLIAGAASIPPAWLPLLDLVYVLAHAGLVLALGLAVLRYHLYDINVVVNKTLVYGALALGVTLVYVGVVAGVGALIGGRGQADLIVSLIATALVAVLFEPIRVRLQRFANRLVYGYRASPYDVLADFSRQVAAVPTTGSLVDRLAEVAARGIGAEACQVRVIAEGTVDYRTVWPATATDGTFGDIVQVRFQDEVVGEIAVRKSAGESLSSTERDLLGSLANQAGAWLQNVRLDQELKARLRAEADRRARELEALYSADSALFQATDEVAILRTLVHVGSEVLQADKAYVMTWDDRNERLVVAAAWGFGADAIEKLSHSPPEGLASMGVTDALVTVKFAEDDSFVNAEVVRIERIVSLARVPLLVAGQLFGVFGTGYCQVHEFTEEDRRLVLALSRRAAQAIERTLLNRQVEENAVLEERQRLARELHDSVTQSLYSTTLLAEASKRIIRAGDFERAASYLDQLGETAQQALREMRLLVYELRPLALEREGLIGALQLRLDAVERRAGVNVRLDAHTGLHLEPDVEAGLYGIAQEALNNVLKHARARSVTVSIRANSEEVELTIQDDGLGFDPSSPPNAGGLGLMSMRERAERLGVRLTIESRPAAGTLVRAYLPLPAPQPDVTVVGTRKNEVRL